MCMHDTMAVSQQREGTQLCNEYTTRLLALTMHVRAAHECGAALPASTLDLS